MNKKSKIKISIEIMDSTEGKVSHTQQIEVDSCEVEDLDSIEQVLLAQGKESMRKVISKQMNEVSKKNLEMNKD
jgi:hypothetical protein